MGRGMARQRRIGEYFSHLCPDCLREYRIIEAGKLHRVISENGVALRDENNKILSRPYTDEEQQEYLYEKFRIVTVEL